MTARLFHEGRRFWLATLFIGALLAASPRLARADFTDLVVFGDSLSDVGNLSDISGGIYPGPYYFNGRVSNGTLWAEHFSTALGLGAIANAAHVGGLLIGCATGVLGGWLARRR